jgi:ATP-dependent Lhr-like helicase
VNEAAESYAVLESFFRSKGWKPFDFQRETWNACLAGKEGIVNAPTGSGKTYSVLGALVLEQLRAKKPLPAGLKMIWITPIRALAKEIHGSASRINEELGLNWSVGIRTGDTEYRHKAEQIRHMPDLLITTPESLHLLLSTKGYTALFENLRYFVVDEWHELMGSKRGVQVELALSRLRSISCELKAWGISATIGNMDEALNVLLGQNRSKNGLIIRSAIRKKISVETLLPDKIEAYPWAGHLGIGLLSGVVSVINASSSTLVFTNTRSQAEIWYQRLLEECPDLAGRMAMHHGSISREMRSWVEDALHEGILSAVVCTSSLDLGVDFRPVESVVQIGGPKGIARFMQRAGRSGHRPGEASRIFFVPTNSLELAEASALRAAIEEDFLENRMPYIRAFDVLVQYLLTLAVSNGFDPNSIYNEIVSTHCFQSVTMEEWRKILAFITTGGESLKAYEEFRRVDVEDGCYIVKNKKAALRHRLSIGTIVSDTMIQVKFTGGASLGSLEEWFVSRLNPGDVFWFAGRSLELVRVKGLTAQVRPSVSDKGIVPSWQGGRMPLSSQMSFMLRKKLHEAAAGVLGDAEMLKLEPLIRLQSDLSAVPSEDEFLIERFKSREGFHIVMFPFEGRLVHEGLAALLAWRISDRLPVTFSIAMNDYGFELLSDREVPLESLLETGWLSAERLESDVLSSLNAVEMARRRFRDIASISGMIFKGFPGKYMREKHVQGNAQLLFDVLTDYDPANLLLCQAYDEAMDFQLEIARLRAALERIASQRLILTQPERPTPFAFPIMVDRLSRERLSSESLEDRISRMVLPR